MCFVEAHVVSLTFFDRPYPVEPVPETGKTGKRRCEKRSDARGASESSSSSVRPEPVERRRCPSQLRRANLLDCLDSLRTRE